MIKYEVFVKFRDQDGYRILKNISEIVHEGDKVLFIKEDGEEYVFNFNNIIYYNPTTPGKEKNERRD